VVMHQDVATLRAEMVASKPGNLRFTRHYFFCDVLI
jgi:hypothetical protein